MVKAAVVGSTGYSGQELVDVLLKNPQVDLKFLTARFEEEMKYADVYPRFSGRTGLVCRKLDVDEIAAACDLVFLALPHTVSMDVAPFFLEKGVKVIDLSADYRIPPDLYLKWYKKEHADADNLGQAVYGLPELNREAIGKASVVANPGCYPTSVILGLLPVIREVRDAGEQVFVDSKSGTSGAGRKGTIPLSFSEVDEDFRCYKANEHQHIPEMETVLSAAAGGSVQINFTPHLLPVKRGILSTIYISGKRLPEEGELREMFMSYYEGEPFVRVRKTSEMPALQDVTGTNFCDIGVKKARGVVIIVSAIDNLLKGASGQAAQNMNIMFGLDERAGLV